MMQIKRTYPLIILSLVFLFNPNINLIDILPDCIAYALLILIIGGFASTVPYLAECKGALVKLFVLTLVKIPAFSVMYSNMKYGSDIVPLFTLSFAVLEFLLIRSATKNLFRTLSYVGERTDCTSVRENFKVSKRKSISPEALEKITVIYFLIKGILNVIPEILLLSKEDFMLRRELMDAYPAALVLSVLASLIIGIIWLRYAIRFVKAIHQSGDFGNAIRTIDSYVRPETSTAEKLSKRLTDSLTLLAISSIFIFDVSFQNFGGYNILPHFIYGIVLFCSVVNLTQNKLHKQLLVTFASGFSLAAIVNQSQTARFFSLYEYAELTYSQYAKADYVPIKISAIAETAFILATIVMTSIILVNFIKEYTEISPSDPDYRPTNKREHNRLIRNTLPLMVISGAINVLKCVNVFLKEHVKIISTDAHIEGIPTSSAPALSTVIFLLSIVFVIYSFVVTSTLKDAVRFKFVKE